MLTYSQSTDMNGLCIYFIFVESTQMNTQVSNNKQMIYILRRAARRSKASCRLRSILCRCSTLSIYQQPTSTIQCNAMYTRIQHKLAVLFNQPIFLELVKFRPPPEQKVPRGKSYQVGQLPTGMYTRLMLSVNGVYESCWESNGTIMCGMTM